MTPIVTLLSDYGEQDSYLAEVKAVFLFVEPRPSLVDLTHQIPAFSVEEGAFQLLRAYGRFPRGTWHLALVDPGATTDGVYVRTRDYHFVGPNNGVLLWAVRDAEKREGRPASVRTLKPSQGFSGFGGRDWMAPWLASQLIQPKKLAKGLIGNALLRGTEFPPYTRKSEHAFGEIVSVDHFGNLITSIPLNDEFASDGRLGKRTRLPAVKTYAEIPKKKTALVPGSHGFWEVSARMDSAARLLGVKKGDRISVRFSKNGSSG